MKKLLCSTLLLLWLFGGAVAANAQKSSNNQANSQSRRVPGFPHLQVPPFTLIAPPNPQSPDAVLGIVPVGQKTFNNAGKIAIFSLRRIHQSGKWRDVYIFVFADTKSAQRFKVYQAKRHSRVLQPTDYRALKPLWPRTLAVLRFNSKNGRALTKSPQNSPNNWWTDW